MNTLLIFVPVVAVFLGFQIAKKYLPWVDALAPLVKQLVILAGCVGGSILYAKMGAPMPDELRSLQSATIIGLIQGLAAMGTHSVKVAANPAP
jgi:hypothetical protein